MRRPSFTFEPHARCAAHASWQEAVRFMWNSRSAICGAENPQLHQFSSFDVTVFSALHFASIAELNVSLSLYTKMRMRLVGHGADGVARTARMVRRCNVGGRVGGGFAFNAASIRTLHLG
ncbi:hypothetical protein L1887_59845 [Cichorium endivia]|nr:hypothetical protein L1887_59845 [Cichorium endivia]